VPTATITSKGQMTIPKPIRDHLRLRPGDRVDFCVDDGGNVHLQPVALNLGQLKGFLQGKTRKHVTIEAMNAAVRARAGARR
jgi:antitoxin PrlF